MTESVSAVRFRALDGRRLELGIDASGRWATAVGGEPLDLTGRWSLPGLADAHAHLAQDRMVLEPGDPSAIRRRAWTYLERGVFCCLDKGWGDHSVLTLLDHPPADRPHLEAAGRMLTAPGGYYPGFAREVEPDELEAAVADEAAAGGGWVKLVGDWPRRGVGAVANFDLDALSLAVGVAHRAGARVAIHTMAPEVPEAAVEAGVDSIEHGLFLTADAVRRLGARGGAWVPTVLRMEAVRDEVGLHRTGGRVIAAGLERVRELLPGASDAGVVVLAGSDLAVPPGGIAAEAARLVDYGLDPAGAVAAVTTAAFTYAGLDTGFTPGAPANLVAFDADPRTDPAVLSHPITILHHGRLLRTQG